MTMQFCKCQRRVKVGSAPILVIAPRPIAVDAENRSCSLMQRAKQPPRRRPNAGKVEDQRDR